MDCTRNGRQLPASRCGAFERLGTDAAEMGVAACPVVEDLDVIEDVGSSEVSGFVDVFSDAPFLQT